MAKINIFYLVAILAIAGACLVRNVKAADQCENQWQTLADACIDYVKKGAPSSIPSKKCCDVVENIDFQCACTHVTPKIEEQISMEMAVLVAKYCERPVPNGMKCGSYTVPGNTQFSNKGQ